MSIARSGGAELVVDAPVDDVWRIASDVTRTGQWSGECREVTWRHGATGPAIGARFRGRNRNGWRRWSRTCELTAIDPPHEIAWRTLPSPLFPDSCAWTIALEPADRGTRIRLSYRVAFLPRWYAWLLGIINPSHADRTAALTEDLERLGRVASTAAADSTSAAE